MNTKINLQNKNVVITGGIGGLGFEICKQLLEKQIQCLAILDVSKDAIEKITELKLKYSNAKIIYVKTDVSNSESVTDAFKLIINEFQYIDVLINSAGILNDRDIQTTINVNFIGVVNATLAAMNVMSKENNGNGGIIATVASAAALTPFFTVPIYTASKYAVLGFMKSISDEYYLKRHEIKFITICPGAADTPIRSNIESRSLFSDMGPLTYKLLKALPCSSAADMATYIIEVVTIGENGSVWITDVNKVKEVNVLTYWP